MTDGPAKIRIDKWLWQARFFKTRSLSAKQVSSGHCRVNGVVVSKPAFGIVPNDVLTFTQAREVRLIKVIALGERRGPAPEAQKLYQDLDPPQARPPSDPVAATPRYDEGGRPSKRDRRALDQLRRDVLE